LKGEIGENIYYILSLELSVTLDWRGGELRVISRRKFEVTFYISNLLEDSVNPITVDKTDTERADGNIRTARYSSNIKQTTPHTYTISALSTAQILENIAESIIIYGICRIHSSFPQARRKAIGPKIHIPRNFSF
jgi:hypothetical protein